MQEELPRQKMSGIFFSTTRHREVEWYVASGVARFCMYKELTVLYDPLGDF